MHMCPPYDKPCYKKCFTYVRKSVTRRASQYPRAIMMAVKVKRKVRDIQKPAGYHVMRLRQKKTPTDLTSTKHLRLAIETQRTPDTTPWV